MAITMLTGRTRGLFKYRKEPNMADETQNAPVAGAQTATTEPTKLYVYYYSDPDGATRKLRYHPIYSETPFDELPWHVHPEKPSEDLNNPVWSNDKSTWVEDIQTSKDEILQQVQDNIEALNNSKQQFDESVKNVQQIQQTSTAQALALTQGIKQLSNSQEGSSKIIASMQQILLKISAQLDAKSNATAPATPATSNQSSQATTATETANK